MRSPLDDDTVPLRSRLPAASIEALADLVAAGYGVAEALEVVPRRSLNRETVRRLDAGVGAVRAGAPIDVALQRLGLDITAAAIRGSQARADLMEEALRSDATARTAEMKALRGTRAGVQLLGIALGGFAVLVLLVAFVVVPSMLEEVAANLPEGWQLPEVLARFEGFRNLWVGTGVGSLLVISALGLVYAGVLGRERLGSFLHELRLHLPFLRAHAIHAGSARLLDALTHERAAGIPASETVRRLVRRESVPSLRSNLELAAARLDAGDPWESCLRGPPAGRGGS